MEKSDHPSCSFERAPWALITGVERLYWRAGRDPGHRSLTKSARAYLGLATAARVSPVGHLAICSIVLPQLSTPPPNLFHLREYINAIVTHKIKTIDTSCQVQSITPPESFPTRLGLQAPTHLQKFLLVSHSLVPLFSRPSGGLYPKLLSHLLNR